MEDGYLLISDVDGTLLGNDDALQEFAQWYDHQRNRLRLVYNSGRLVESVLDSIDSTELPAPDAVIGGVGTEIYCSKTEQRIERWPNTGPGWKPERISAVLDNFKALQLQPSEFQSDYKFSYYAYNASSELLTEIQAQLAAAGCEVDVVYSSARDLDVLPAGVNKGSAANFIASHWSIAKSQVVVSGDTGNDLAMFQRGFRGIVVANALKELKQLNGSSIFHATKPHAAGVQEGLVHWLDSSHSESARTSDHARRE